MKKYLLFFFAFLFLNSGSAFAFPSAEKITPEKASKQAIENLLNTFEKAFIEEDIDLLGSIISEDVPDRDKLLESFENAFRRHIYLSFRLAERKITFNSDGADVSAKLIQTFEDIIELVNETQAYNVSVTIKKKAAANGGVVFSITSLLRKLGFVVIRNSNVGRPDNPFEIRVFSSDADGSSNIASAAIVARDFKKQIKLKDEAEEEVSLDGKSFNLKGLKGEFNLPSGTGEKNIRVKVETNGGETVIMPHVFRVSDKEIESVETGEAGTKFYASAIDRNNVLWVGGDGGGKVFRSADGKTVYKAFNLAECLTVKNLPDNTRINDMVIDSLNRDHLIFYGSEYDESGNPKRIVAGDAVFDTNKEDIICEDISLLIDYDLTSEGWKGEDGYPFSDAENNRVAFTRVLPADDGSIWLLGSDGGVAKFSDSREVRYNPVFRRSDSAETIVSNTVPAATIDRKGNVWFGTILGVNKYDITNEKFSLFTYVPNRKLDTAKLDTLEEYFNAIASLIQNNKNISSGLGNINFKETFGTDLVKEDFIWSSATDKSGRLWFGTLGGGIRVFEKGKERKDMHLTKQNGLISNIILSIAVDGNNNIWIGTEQGVSKIQNSKFKIQNFSELDGLGSGPVWDITADNKGNVWFATQSGIFKYPGN